LLGGRSMPERTRRFPPPWSVEEAEACFLVKDRGGQALAYVYFEEELGLIFSDDLENLKRSG
jgi:hypothetical protein